jgi:hypothetical protein
MSYNHEETLILKSLAIGRSKTAVLRRLKECISVMKREGKEYFRQGHYIPKRKMIVGPDGKYAIQWRLRPYPNKPSSYENQQTSAGTVVVLELR